MLNIEEKNFESLTLQYIFYQISKDIIWIILTFTKMWYYFCVNIEKGENSMQRKLSEKVLMLLLTLAIITIGSIVVAVLSNNNTMAVNTTCSQWGNMVSWEYMDEIQHSYTWRNCINFVTGNHSWITTISSNENSSETHIASKVCSFCGYLVKQEYVACYDNNSDGICDACGRVGMHVHNYTEKECIQNDSDTHIVTLKCLRAM